MKIQSHQAALTPAARPGPRPVEPPVEAQEIPVQADDGPRFSPEIDELQKAQKVGSIQEGPRKAEPASSTLQADLAGNLAHLQSRQLHEVAALRLVGDARGGDQAQTGGDRHRERDLNPYLDKLKETFRIAS